MQSKNLKSHKYIIFAIDHYNSLGVARSLGEEGLQSILVSLKGRWPVTEKSKYVKEVYNVESHDEGLQILCDRFGNEEEDKLPFIITCDDVTMRYLDDRYEELKDKFIFFNAGRNGRITEYMDKFKILEIAKKHGFNILKTEMVERGVVPASLEYPIITKSISPVVGGWKSDVFICNSERELKMAYTKIKSPKVLIQKYINKKNEYCLDGFSINCGNSHITTIESTYNYLIPGYYSPYMTVKNFNNPEIESKLYSMLNEIGFEGIWCTEFLIDQDGTYYFTEVNFRNSTWSYASTEAGMNLVVGWIKATLDNEIDRKNLYKKIPDNFTAMVEPIDYQKRVVEGETELGEWLRDFKEVNCSFYYSKDDIKPFYEMMLNWKKLN